MNVAQKRQVVLEANRTVNPGVHVLSFHPSDSASLDFEPGQYVTFFLNRLGKQITRSYSFFSTPKPTGGFDLLIRRVPGGYGSTLLCGLVAEDHPTLGVLAPLGRFGLRDPESRAVVFVATGTGIAPFVPMMDELRSRYSPSSVWLIFGNRHREDAILYDQLRALEAEWSGFHFVPVLSRPPFDGGWTGAVGHVETVLAERFPDLSGADVYLCGVPEMVNETQALALSLGCPKDRVVVERY